MTQIYDVIIIGGGPAGYTAGLYGVRAGLNALLLEKVYAGGQIAVSHQVDNYPGLMKACRSSALELMPGEVHASAPPKP